MKLSITKTNLHKLYIYIMISLVLQICIFFYINNFYLKSANIDNVEFVDADKLGEQKNNIESFNIPSNMKDIKVSNDFMYTSFIDGNKLMSLRLDNSSSPKTVYELEDGEEISNYYWLKDRLYLFIGIKKTYRSYSTIKFYTYDIKNESLKKFKDNAGRLAALPKNAYIDQMELSTYTNTAYFKIVTSDSESRIYSAKTMNLIDSSFRINTSKEARIAEYNFCDSLVYEKNGSINIWNTQSNVSGDLIDGNVRIIGVDMNDIFYFCYVDSNNYVEKIVYGVIKDLSKLDLSKSNKFELKQYEPERKIKFDDLELSYYGVLYTNDEKNKKLDFVLYDNDESMKVDTKKEVKYEGEFLELVEENIVYKNDGNIVIGKIENEEK